MPYFDHFSVTEPTTQSLAYLYSEAIACGCPVVCSNTSSLSEIAGDAAILIDPTAVEQLADGIRRVLSDDNLRGSLRDKGLERASHFSWERSARETLEVLKAVHTRTT